MSWWLIVKRPASLVHRGAAPLVVNQFLKFCLVGLSGVFVDMGLLFLLSDPSMLAWGLAQSKAVGSEAAILNNFLWNDAWTFREASADEPATGNRLRRLLKFNLICGVGLVLGVGLLNVQVSYLRMNRYVANAVAIVLVASWNFYLSRKLSWKVLSRPPARGIHPPRRPESYQKF